MPHRHTFRVDDIVEVYEDLMIQRKHEGFAKIVKIHKQDNEICDCDVRFHKDYFQHKEPKMEEKVVRRQIKR